MYPQLKCGGRVMRDVAGPCHRGWNWALTSIGVQGSAVNHRIPELQKIFWRVVLCCHKVSRHPQSCEDDLVNSVMASGVAFKTKA